MVGTLPKDKFSDTSQEPILSAGLLNVSSQACYVVFAAHLFSLSICAYVSRKADESISF